MSVVKLDDYEEEIIRYLAKEFNEGELSTSETHFPRANEMGGRPFQIRNRFVGLGWLYWEDRGGMFGLSLRISPEVLQIVHELDNPPAIDHWESLLTWFRSKPWSLPFILVFVGLPALWNWVEMLNGMLRWFGVKASD